MFYACHEMRDPTFQERYFYSSYPIFMIYLFLFSCCSNLVAIFTNYNYYIKYIIYCKKNLRNFALLSQRHYNKLDIGNLMLINLLTFITFLISIY